MSTDVTTDHGCIIVTSLLCFFTSKFTKCSVRGHCHVCSVWSDMMHSFQSGLQMKLLQFNNTIKIVNVSLKEDVIIINIYAEEGIFTVLKEIQIHKIAGVINLPPPQMVISS